MTEQRQLASDRTNSSSFTGSNPKAVKYYQGINNWLLHAVPNSAKIILEVGCAAGRLGAALKDLDPGRVVYGIEKIPEVAQEARSKLDQVFVIDVENQDPDIEPGTLDCILYGDVLEHLIAPLEVLRRHQQLLKPNGEIICCIPNVQHFSVLRKLFSGDFQYESAGLMDATHLRFFTYSTFIKLLLDAGYAPELLTSIDVKDRSDLIHIAEPFITALGLDIDHTTNYLSAYQYIFRGRPLRWEKRMAETSLSFVACVNNEEQLNANLLRSHCFKQPSIHELILVRGAKSAADGLNYGLERATNEIVILLHQEIYLPPGWPQQFIEQYRLAEQAFGTIGMAGFFGVRKNNGQKSPFGHVVDRHRLLSHKPLPALVDTVDELAMAVPKSSTVRFDPALGWHLYGADFALQTTQDLKAIVALDALCFHHSKGSNTVPVAYHQSAATFRQKWADQLPIFTPYADFI